jgi:hypothetical protein
MTNSQPSQVQTASEGASKRLYEPPRLTIIGPLERITLGSVGPDGDGPGSKRTAPGN